MKSIVEENERSLVSRNAGDTRGWPEAVVIGNKQGLNKEWFS